MRARGFNGRFPPLAEFCSEQVLCKFCGSDDLRMAARYRESYVACARCGADGPIGTGPFDAVDLYQGRVEWRRAVLRNST